MESSVREIADLLSKYQVQTKFRYNNACGDDDKECASPNNPIYINSTHYIYIYQNACNAIRQKIDGSKKGGAISLQAKTEYETFLHFIKFCYMFYSMLN